jgi:hypothetical protein
VQWLKSVQFKERRNLHECEEWALVADALINRQLDTALRVSVRRLTGVYAADQHEDWDLADLLSLHPPDRGLLSRDDVHGLLKQAAALKKWKKPGKTRQPPSFDSGLPVGVSNGPRSLRQNLFLAPLQRGVVLRNNNRFFAGGAVSYATFGPTFSTSVSFPQTAAALRQGCCSNL